MKIKLNYTIIIVFVLSSILTTTDSNNAGTTQPGSHVSGNMRNRFRNIKNGYINGIRNIELAFKPRYNSNNISKLLYFVLHDADSIKAAAFRRLNDLYKVSKSMENKQHLIIPLIRSATELIKSYGVVNNILKIKLTYNKGEFYSKQCVIILSRSIGECYKAKALLLEAYFFSNKMYTNRYLRRQIKNTYVMAKNVLKDDQELEYMNTKIACELKLMTQDKIVRKAKELYVGSTLTERQLDCPALLLQFKNHINTLETYPGGYYYLLGRSLAKSGKIDDAIVYLHDGRKLPVNDKKSRYINKQIQEYLEKIYLSEYSVPKNT